MQWQLLLSINQVSTKKRLIMLLKKNTVHPSFIPYSELSDEEKNKIDKELQMLEIKHRGFELHPLVGLILTCGIAWAILYFFLQF